MYDLIVVGGSAQGLSAAITAHKVGAHDVLVLESGTSVAYPHLVGPELLDVKYGQKVASIDSKDDSVVITTDDGATFEAKSCVIAVNSRDAVAHLPPDVSADEYVHEVSYEGDVEDKDILVVGDNDRAVVLASRYIDAGARSVVLAAKPMNPDVLSNASRAELKKREKDRQLTVLYRSVPVASAPTDDDSVFVQFNDTNPPMPALEFDHVVYAATQQLVEPSKLGITDDAMASGRVAYARDPRLEVELPSGTCNEIISGLSQYFTSVDPEKLESISVHTPDYAYAPEDLRRELYNATVVSIEKKHSDLWRIQVRPDHGNVSFEPGQYVQLSMGFWEPKLYEGYTDEERQRWDQLIPRSYSVSSPIFDKDGNLSSGVEDGCVEFYIVLVPPELDPVNTPRLALLEPGSRLFMGAKITGLYTLRNVKPDDNVAFFATGTGEAPNNAMITHLLSRGHQGKIINAVNVREARDLGYLEEHRRLEEMFPNYTYWPLPTREPNVPKRYLKSLILDGDIEELFGDLDPAHTRVFMCGNPSMVGAPHKHTHELPEEPGIVGILLDRGMTIAKGKGPGNLHYDLYW